MPTGHGSPSVAIVQNAAAALAVDVANLAWQERGCEWGGIAWGLPYSLHDGGLAVWIAAMTPGLGTGSAVDFVIDPESYVVGLRMLRKAGFPEHVEEVGLWHSHPGYGAFLSTVDEDYFRLLHPQPWKVSVVIDPINEDYGVFVKTGDGVERIPACIYSGSALGRIPRVDARPLWRSMKRARS